MLILDLVLDCLIIGLLLHRIFLDVKKLQNLQGEKPEVAEELSEHRYPEYSRVSAFRNRVEQMRKEMDENGLYDVTIPPPVTDFTGVEIITDSTEIQQDRRF